MNAALPFAQQMLAKHGEFFPYAVAMRRDRQIAMIAGYTGTEKPPSTEVIDILYDGLRSEAEENRGAAIVADVRLKGEGTDAIQVEVEHREGIALKVFLPYRKKRFGGGLEVGQMRAEPGERRIWPL
ncbi:MAG TPA: hypothetical protein VJT14_06280 [Candidatus Dormibacteraeota bacterium]|nr:hypothetical protein [Candidatus Dormibacteraeota bacterium]